MTRRISPKQNGTAAGFLCFPARLAANRTETTLFWARAADKLTHANDKLFSAPIS